MRSMSAAVLFAVLSSFVGNAFSAPESYRVYAYPKSTIDTFHTQLTYGNSSIVIGNIKFQRTTEPLILTAPSEEGIMSFLSYHAERYQLLYVIPEGAEDLKVSPWQVVPPEASTTGFAVAEDGLFSWNGIADAWWVCPLPEAPVPNSYAVKFAKPGKDMTGCTSADLKAEGYGKCVS